MGGVTALDLTTNDPLEQQVIAYAAAMTRTPVEVPAELVTELRAALGDAGLVELTAIVAWENHRARFNHAFDVESENYVEGAACRIR